MQSTNRSQRSGHPSLLTAFVLPAILLSAFLPQFADSKGRPAAGEPVTHFDFLENLGRAHIRQNGLIIDFGADGLYKYIFGEERGTFAVSPETPAGCATLSADRGEIRFLMREEEAGGGIIGIRAGAGDAAQAAIVLNGTPVGELLFPTEGLAYRELPVSQGIVAGENAIGIRLLKDPAQSGQRPASLYIDYIRVVPDGALREDTITSSEEAPFAIISKDPSGLTLPEDIEVSFNLFIPHEARLALELASPPENAGQLELLVQTDTGDSLWEQLAPSGSGESLVIPLYAISGEAARVTFRALNGDVDIEDARILSTRDSDEVRNPRPPIRNALIVLVDTLRRDRLRVYDQFSKVNAPGVERIGRESVVFDRAFAQSNWTKPSVATLFSSLYPSIHTANTHRATLPSNVAIMPEIFEKQGFATAGFVANGYITDKFGFGRGWGHFDAYGTPGRPDYGGLVVQDALRWMTKTTTRERFFAYVHTTDVHAPYVSPRKIWSRYDPSAYNGAIQPRETASLLNRIRAGSRLLAPRDSRRLRAFYDGAVTYHDHAIKRLMDTLSKAGILEDTVVIFTSDHGEEFFDHGSVGHGHTLFEELVHIPLLIRMPDRRDPVVRRIDEEVGLVDILPTLCELLQTTCPEEAQGTSLAPLIFGEGLPFTREVSISEFPGEQKVALRNGRFKTIFHRFDTVLYDMLSDPGETVDKKSAYPIARQAMIDLLGAHLGRLAKWEKPLNPAGKGGVSPSYAQIDEETHARLQALGYMGD